MRRTAHRRLWSRRGWMFLIVGIQILILLAIVVPQEINRAWDSGLAVDLEILSAHASKDPFRGASISGRPALDLDAANAVLPAERLQPGERVLVYFAVVPGKRPRITEVARRGSGSGPPFSPERFSIPGTVRRPDGTRNASGYGGDLVARVGKPAVSVELDLPASIPVDDAALHQLVGPALVRASLRQGFLGHRYFGDVRLSGRAWTDDIVFAYDEAQDRLVVFAPQQDRLHRVRPSADQPLHTTLFFFDGSGKEMRSAEVVGRLIEGVINPADGTLWALVSGERWGPSMVRLAQVRDDGAVAQQSPQVSSDRIVGFDAAGAAVWVLAGGGPPNARLLPPFFVERMTLGGVQGPRLGPFPSRPSSVRTSGQQVWVLEPERHRVTRLDRTGRIERDYTDLNRPTHIAVDAGSLVVVEAEGTQLSKFSMEGRLIWRIPRFQGLAWILPEPGTGGGWVGAQRFENGGGGVLRYDRDGKISWVPGVATPRMTRGWGWSRLAPDAVRSVRHGRLYIREERAITILAPDGTVLKRVEGFRYATEQGIRG